MPRPTLELKTSTNSWAAYENVLPESFVVPSRDCKDQAGDGQSRVLLIRAGIFGCSAV
jgi:hypothetical protein